MTEQEPGQNRSFRPGGRRELGPDASAEQRFDALRHDFAGLHEVCRWQWQLLQRIQEHLAHLPPTWGQRRE